MPTSNPKKIVYKNEPVFVTENGEQVPYVPKEIKTKRDAYAASLHLVLKHTADFHVLMVEVLCDKYGLSVDDVIGTIREDPRILAMTTDPVLEAMGHFTEEDMKKCVNPTEPSINDITEGIQNLALQTDVPAKKPRGRPKKSAVNSIKTE